MTRSEEGAAPPAGLRAGVVTESPEATAALGAQFAAALPEDAVVTLAGDLGSGKTTFIGGMARGWGIDQPVTSPTFNLFTIYQGTRQLVHLDAYRLESGEQMDALMLEDFLRPPWCIAVEWPTHVASWLPDGAIRIELAIVAPGRHRIRLIDGVS